MPFMPRTLSALAALCVAGLMAGCGGGNSEAKPTTSPVASTRPSSTAEVRILAPEAGDVQNGPTVALRVGLTGAKIVPYTSTDLKPNEGHLHVLLDGRLISMTLGLDQEIKDVARGAHVLRVEFVANDHAPFQPRVVQEVTFEVS